MNDLFGAELQRWQAVEAKLRDAMTNFGYSEIRTPSLEKIEVFKAVGDETDIVEKQMYQVQDRGAHPDSKPEILVMRPEGTAGFIRAVMEHGLANTGHVSRFYYLGPMFRYERPQKGRLRQFHQLGAELIYDGSAEADAELIILLDHLLKSVGLKSENYEIRINSVGCKDCRPAYREKLIAYFKPHFAELCENCQRRLERAPMRILDCKNEVCKKLSETAPLGIDNLDEACAKQHARVKECLKAEDVTFVEDPYIVRGLDYYSRTAFEFTSNLLGAQSALGGGGRYDGLSARFGKLDFPSVGWAIGMERVMLALDAVQAKLGDAHKPVAFLAPMGAAAFDKLFPLSLKLKKQGVHVEMSYEKEKGLKWLLKQADRVQAGVAVIVGDQELASGQASVKELATGQQKNVAIADLEKELLSMKGRSPSAN